MSTRIRLTGFCTPGNPADSHARCTGDIVRGPSFPDPVACECDCHLAAKYGLVEAVTPTTPTGVLVTEAEPESVEWFAARREGITGTDLPKILGLTKYGNALSVWLDKRGELDDLAGEAARWGSILEEPVAQEWAHRHGTSVTPVGVLANVDEPWLRASLDRLVDTCPDGDAGRCGLEIKTRSAFKADEWRDGMPDSVLAQVAWGRRVSGLDHMHVAALIGGQRLVAFRYDRDDVLEDYLVDQARPVWQSVLEGLPPDVAPDGDGILLDLLDRMYAKRAGDREVDETEAARWLATYDEGAALERDGKRMKTEAKTALVQLLGDGDTGLIDEAPAFTYIAPDPSPTVTADDLRAFRTTNPDQFAALLEAGLITMTNPGPRFNVKKRTKKETA